MTASLSIILVYDSLKQKHKKSGVIGFPLAALSDAITSACVTGVTETDSSLCSYECTGKDSHCKTTCKQKIVPVAVPDGDL